MVDERELNLSFGFYSIFSDNNSQNKKKCIIESEKKNKLLLPTTEQRDIVIVGRGFQAAFITIFKELNS